jgi:hypothetical protein
LPPVRVASGQSASELVVVLHAGQLRADRELSGLLVRWQRLFSDGRLELCKNLVGLKTIV